MTDEPKKAGNFSRTPSAAAEDPMLPDAEFRTLGVLGEFANEAGICGPSVENVARRRRKSVRTILRHFRLLESLGYLVVFKRVQAGRNGWGRNTYKLVYPPVDLKTHVTSRVSPSDQGLRDIQHVTQESVPDDIQHVTQDSRSNEHLGDIREDLHDKNQGSWVTSSESRKQLMISPIDQPTSHAGARADEGEVKEDHLKEDLAKHEDKLSRMFDRILADEIKKGRGSAMLAAFHRWAALAAEAERGEPVPPQRDWSPALIRVHRIMNREKNRAAGDWPKVRRAARNLIIGGFRQQLDPSIVALEAEAQRDAPAPAEVTVATVRQAAPPVHVVDMALSRMSEEERSASEQLTILAEEAERTGDRRKYNAFLQEWAERS